MVTSAIYSQLRAIHGFVMMITCIPVLGYPYPVFSAVSIKLFSSIESRMYYTGHAPPVGNLCHRDAWLTCCKMLI